MHPEQPIPIYVEPPPGAVRVGLLDAVQGLFWRAVGGARLDDLKHFVHCPSLLYQLSFLGSCSSFFHSSRSFRQSSQFPGHFGLQARHSQSILSMVNPPHCFLPVLPEHPPEHYESILHDVTAVLVVPTAVFSPIPFLPASPGGLNGPEFQPAHWALIPGAEARLNRPSKAEMFHAISPLPGHQPPCGYIRHIAPFRPR